MFSFVKLITVVESLSHEARQRLVDDLRRIGHDLPGTRSVLAESTLPGVYNGGDIIWRVEFENRADYDVALSSLFWRESVAALLSHSSIIAEFQSAAYESLKAGGRSPGTGVYRVALFCANQKPTPERLEQWAVETSDMPKHVKTISSWQLGKVVETRGSRPWTHVWEQEYETLEGLTGAYMMHPCHWAQVDRWFDPEFPEWLVDPELCHTFCATAQPAIMLP